MFSNIKAVEQDKFINAMESNFKILFIESTSFGYYIKSKHDVFSDGTEQKCLRFSQVF